jgi:hypothetical protein
MLNSIQNTMKTTSLIKTISWLSLFAIAMGFLESSVVIYLRELYYPHGFQFPLQIIPSKIAKVELCREIATIIMLVGAAYLAGTNKLTRFACFLIAFAIWDIFYYVFLYLFIDWPQNIFTWDILFLIPFPWTGPVIAPCLVAFGMAVFGLCILFTDPHKLKVSRNQWFLLIGGCVVIISSFLYDYFCIVNSQHQSPGIPFSTAGLFYDLTRYVPNKFNWYLFSAGMILSCTGVFLFLKQSSLFSLLKS